MTDLKYSHVKSYFRSNHGGLLITRLFGRKIDVPVVVEGGGVEL